MSEAIRLLMIEDNEDDALLIQRHLDRSGLSIESKRVSTADEFRNSLESQIWDIILCDHSMTSFTSQDALVILNERDLDIPFVIVSGTISEETAVKMMKAGAHDYLTKDQLTRLAPAIRREIGDAKGRRERREALSALRDSEKRHRTLLESIRDTVFVVNEDLTISECYSSSLGTLDIDKSTVVGKEIAEILPSEFAEGYSKHLTNLHDVSGQSTFDFSLEEGGEKKWFSANLSRHEDGERVVVILRDVSSLKLTQEELSATSKIAMLYLDLMGHDLRNLLQAIMISTNLLGSSVNDAASLRLLYEISGCVEECDELISTVLATKDLLKIPLEKVSLDAVLNTCANNLTEIYRNAVISVKTLEIESFVAADRFINLLLSNLIDNAIKHNHKESPKVWVSIQPTENGFAVHVADDGPGVHDEMKEVLFDPGSRVGGVGIHQSIQIAEKYGGTIKVKDRVDKEWQQGAEIIISFPKYNEDI